jgi:hypothetical protein
MTITNRRTAMKLALVLGVAGMMWPGRASRAQTVPAQMGSNRSYEMDVPGTKEWVDTKIDVRGGAKLRFTATGENYISSRPILRGEIANIRDIWPRWAPAKLG